MTDTASFSIDEIREVPKGVIGVLMDPRHFNVLSQVRQENPIDPELIDSFFTSGQLFPGMVAALKPEEARIYVNSINSIFGAHHRLEDLTPTRLDGVVYYLCMIAGHRRHYNCQVAAKGIRDGVYEATEHFDGRYRAQLHFQITVEQAIALQFIENRYSAPPIHDEATGAWRFFRYLKTKNAELTHGQFAKTIGRSSDWFRSAVRFCSLPHGVQAYVLGDNPMKLKLPYGMLVELARLSEGWEAIKREPFSEELMHRWVREAFAEQLNTTAFGRKVSAFLEDLRQQEEGQVSLFDFKESAAQHKKRVRLIVEKSMVPGLWQVLQYVLSVERVHKAGLFGTESYLGPAQSAEDLARYSPKSPIRLVSETASVIDGLMPHLAELARRERTGHFRRLKARGPEFSKVRALLSGFAEYEQRHAA